MERDAFQPPGHLSGPPVGLFQYAHVLILLGSPKLNTVHQVWSHKSKIKEKNHFIWLAGYIFPNTSQDVVSCHHHKDRGKSLVSFERQRCVRATNVRRILKAVFRGKLWGLSHSHWEVFMRRGISVNGLHLTAGVLFCPAKRSFKRKALNYSHIYSAV